MELLLEHQTQTQIRVTCDGQASHTFDLSPFILSNDEGPPDDVVAYGEALYLALFPLETPARLALDNKPERILLVATQSDLDAIAWEYLYGPDGFLVLEHHFVRGLPASQRLAPPVLDVGLHIIAVPSNPLSNEVESLDIDGEWLRLKEIIRTVPSGLVLERTRPATVEQVRRLLANQRHRVVHFMGHGAQVDKNAAYPKAIADLKASEVLPESVELRQVKYLNNLVEHDHRFIKRLVKPGMGFFSVETAGRTLQGYEGMHMIRKGQMRGMGKRTSRGRLRSTPACLEWSSKLNRKGASHPPHSSKSFCNTTVSRQ